MELKESLTDEESNHIIDLQSELGTASKKQLRHLRRRIRYRLFRIREGRYEFDKGLKKYIEQQFSPDMNWDTFTFNWDVAPYSPLEVITPWEWGSRGGKFDNVNVMCDDGIVRPEKICDPSAFTKQG